jgi:glycerol kinase
MWHGPPTENAMPKKKKYVLAIDQGTTGTHVCIVDENLSVVGKAYQEFRQFFPRPSWVEHDLEDIWQSVEECVHKALAASSLSGRDISAIGITNQRETAGLWRREGGRPIARAIVWQDRRTADVCKRLTSGRKGPFIRRKTGLVIDPYFSATKVAWLLDNVRGARKAAESGALAFGTVDSWLVYKLTSGKAHLTDVSNASRTQLFDIHSLRWDEGLCELFGVPAAVLPEVKGSAEIYGETRGMRALPDGIPVSGMAGDQQAALFGQACFAPGEAKCTYGTGAFLLMNTGTRAVPSKRGLLTTIAWTLGKETHYALEGSAFIAGAAVQWLRDGLGLIRSAAEVEELARTVEDSGEVTFVPALAGLGAPHWRPDARGLFTGLSRATTCGHLARAVLEGIALQIFELADAMRQDSGRPIRAMKVDGGASANNLLMQFQSDVLHLPVIRPKNLETTSMGAAFLGGLGAGVWKGPEEIRRSWRADLTFRAKMARADRDAHLKRWKRAVSKA